MAIDITQVQYSSTIDTFKNYSSTTGSISIPSQSYTAGQTRSFTNTVDLSRVDAVTQVLQNYSFDNSKYYVGTHAVLFGTDSVDTNFQIITQCTMATDTLSVTTFVTNTDASPHTVPAFTLNLEVRRFVTPFE